MDYLWNVIINRIFLCIGLILDLCNKPRYGGHPLPPFSLIWYVGMFTFHLTTSRHYGDQFITFWKWYKNFHLDLFWYSKYFVLMLLISISLSPRWYSHFSDYCVIAMVCVFYSPTPKNQSWLGSFNNKEEPCLHVSVSPLKIHRFHYTCVCGDTVTRGTVQTIHSIHRLLWVIWTGFKCVWFDLFVSLECDSETILHFGFICFDLLFSLECGFRD